MKKENLISEEVAVQELTAFVKEWVEDYEELVEEKNITHIKKFMPKAYKALLGGDLVLEDNKPVYTLNVPATDVKGEVFLRVITFKTRIPPMDQAAILKGIDIKIDQYSAMLQNIAFITGLALPILNNLDKRDYDTIVEIASLFM